MTEWKLFNDYIYAVDAYDQSLLGYSVHKETPDTLLIFGQETHKEEDPETYEEIEVSDPNGTLYRYTESTNTLTKICGDLESVLSEYVTTNFGGFTYNYWGGGFIITDEAHPLIALNVYTNSYTDGGVTYSLERCTVVLRATVEGYTALFDSYTSNYYTEVRRPTLYSITPYFIGHISYNSIGHRGIWGSTVPAIGFVGATSDYRYPVELLYTNSGKRLYFKGQFSTDTFELHHVPPEVKVYVRISSSGFELFGSEPAYLTYEDGYTGSAWNEDTYRIVNTTTIGAYLTGTSFGALDLLSEIHNRIERGDSTLFYADRYLVRGDGEVLDAEFATTGQVGSHPLSSLHNCTTSNSLTLDADFHLKSYTQTNQVNTQSRRDGNLYRKSGDTSGCTDPQWDSLDLPESGTYSYSYAYGRFYVWNTGLFFTLYYTDYPDSFNGYVTFFGIDHAYLPFVAKKYGFSSDTLPLEARRGYHLRDNIYATNELDGYIHYIEWPFYLQADPTSITILGDELVIGGSTDSIELPSGTVFLVSGEVSTQEASLSGWKERPIFAQVEIPELSASGYVPTNNYTQILPSGNFSLVKEFNNTILLHGDLLPDRLLQIVPGISVDNLSYNLPSGISRSVDYDSNDNIYLSLNVESTGRVYTLSGETWSLERIDDPISTALITEDDFIFIGHSGTIPGVTRYTTSWQAADTGLPSGIIVTDLEEDFYADR